jgi:hypothetical protein
VDDYLQDLARDYQQNLEKLDRHHYWCIQNFRRAYTKAVQQWWELHNRRNVSELIEEYVELNSFITPLGS